jgi:branched-chain amino acid transport system substrate-binding protein
MPRFHRFCGVIPLFFVLFLLSGCGGGQGWTPQDASRQDGGNVYGSAPVQQPSLPAGSLTSTPAAVKVAILLPLSGSNAAIGQSMLQAAQLAVFDVGSDNFELISKDTGGTPQGAASAATAAINEGAQLILGPLFAEEVRAIRPVTAARNINVLAFSTDWTLAGGNVYVMGFTPFGQVERIASYAGKSGLRRVAIAAPADTYGNTVSRSFENEAGKYGLTTTKDVSNAGGYDAVFIPAPGQTLNTFLMQITNPSAAKLGTGLWDDPRLAAIPQMNGATFAAPSPSARRGFEQKYQATYGSSPTRIASLAYDAAALSIALSKMGYTAQNLKSPNGFAGVDGIMRFGSNGLIERGLSVLQFQSGRILEIDPAPMTFR